MNIKDKLKEAVKIAFKNKKGFKEEYLDNDPDLIEYLQNGEISRESIGHSRHWEDMVIISKIGNRYFSFCGAVTTGDSSPEEKGWEFDWDSLEEVEPYEQIITITKYKKVI